MTDEEAYAIQAFGGLLEFAMATYEKLIHTKSSSQSELRRHKSVIEDSVISMGPEMLKACGHMNLPGNSGKHHPRWRMCIRVQDLLKQILITGLQPSAVVNIYLQEQEKYRAENIK